MRKLKFRAWNPDKKIMLNNPMTGRPQPINEMFDWSFYNWMMCTGLKDDGGNDIYEGDLLIEYNHYEGDNWINDRTLKVVFECGSFIGEDINNKNIYSDIDCSGITIVGNIYEN